MNRKQADVELIERDEQLEKYFNESLEIETRFGIVMAIRTYGSLNIKMLASILGKTESTVFHHVSEMTKEPKIIEIDLEKTEKLRGKYFRLTEVTVNRYKEDEQVFEEKIPEKIRSLLQLPDEKLQELFTERVKENPGLARAGMRKLKYHYQLGNFILKNTEKAERLLQEGQIPARTDFPCGSYSLVSIDMKISSPRHALRIGEVINDFFKRLYALKREIADEMKEKNISDEDMINEHYFLFGGELNEFPFRKPV